MTARVVVTCMSVLWTLGFAMPSERAGAQRVGEVFRDCDVCPEMVMVPAGSFMMGSPDTEEGRVDPYESPQHRVVINSAFAVGVYEITVDQWTACVRGDGCPEDGGPYEKRQRRTNAGGCRVGSTRGSTRTGCRGRRGTCYRLPSEAEWEYVAQGWDADRRATGATHRSRTVSVRQRVRRNRPQRAGLRLPGYGRLPRWASGTSRRRSDRSDRTVGGSTTCWGMRASGWMTAGTRGYDGAPTDGSSWYTGNCQI